jgi:hypothetical protein
LELGLFITASSFGFQFSYIGFVFKCIYLYSEKHLSCDVNSKIFSMIIEGVNYVIREVTEFFSNTGRVIATKTVTSVLAAAKEISTGIKTSVGYLKNYSGVLVDITTDAFLDLKNQFEEELKWLKNGFKNYSKRVAKVISKAANIALKKTELTACEVKYIFNRKKKKKCKDKVRDKYDNDSNNDISLCSSEYNYTSLGDDGDGSIYQLANHTIDCGTGKLLSSFKLERSGDKMRYRYKCVEDKDDTNYCVIKTTTSNVVNSDYFHSINYLDRHTLDCSDGYAIRKVQLIKSGSQIYFSYSCCKASLNYCSYNETKNEDRGDKSTHYLDRLEVNAGNFRVLKGFKFNSSGDEQMNYSYTSCGISTKAKTTFSTDCNDDANGSIYGLTDHYISCPPGSAVSRFQLKRVDDDIRYDYYCVYSPYIYPTLCKDYTTPVNSVKSGDSGHSAHYLDRHTVDCPDNTVLTKFGLNRNSDDKIYYSYNCCSAKLSSCADEVTSKTDSGDKETYYLDRQNVDTGNYAVLNSFKLNSDGDNYTYSYRECALST